MNHLSIDVIKTESYITLDIPHPSTTKGEEGCLFTQAPKFRPHRCVKNSIDEAFKKIALHFEELFENGTVSLLEKRHIESGRRFVIHFDDDKKMAVGACTGLCFNQAFPHMLDYISYQSSLPAEQFQDLLDRDCEIELLLKKLRKKAAKQAKITDVTIQVDEQQELHLSAMAAIANLSGEAHEFFRRVPQDELIPLFMKILNRDQECSKLSKGCQAGMDNEHEVLEAFHDFIQGNIHVMQLSTILLAHDCQRICQEPKESFTYQLLNHKGEIDEKAFDILVQGIADFFNALDLENFLSSLKNGDPKETQFFKIMPEDLLLSEEEVKKKLEEHNAKTEENKPVNLLAYYYHMQKNRTCLSVSKDAKLELLVLPPSLYWQLLKAKWQEQAMKPNPVLGLSKGVDFEHVDHRDVLIPCSLLSSPTHADGFPISRLGFYHHDLIYHTTIDSANFDRAAWIDLARGFKERKRIKIWMSLVDREFPSYYNRNFQIAIFGRELEKQEIFWSTLVYAHFRFFYDKRNEKIFIPYALQHIASHETQWKNDYHIDFQGLKQFYEKQKQMPHEASMKLLEPWIKAWENLVQHVA